LRESVRSINRKIGRGLERSHLATRNEDELCGDSDGRCAKAYGATKVQYLCDGIPARRENGVITVGGLHRDKVTVFPLFWKG
jgi:hypothetical protein